MGLGIIDGKEWIEEFIGDYAAEHNLDPRTKKAYRMDLNHFYAWAQERREDKHGPDSEEYAWEDWMDAYLDYLSIEKNLSFSTIYRKNRVLSYYLAYLARRGVISSYRSLKAIKRSEEGGMKGQTAQGLLSRKDADAFFAAMNREYEGLDSEFRRRVCLRDMVMMELLFYHKMEISELLQIEIQDYDQKNGVLTIQRKRGMSHGIHLYSQGLLKKMALWLEERKAFQREGEYENRMFLSKLGRPLSMEMVIQIFDKYRRLAGIEKELTPKDLKESSMKVYARELMVERCS